MIYFNICFSAIVIGLLWMVRGRGLSDYGGIQLLTSKGVMVGITAGIIALNAGWVPALAWAIGISLFWIDPGKLHQTIYLDPIKINQPDINWIDWVAMRVVGPVVTGDQAANYTLIYNLLYTLFFIPAFAVLYYGYRNWEHIGLGVAATFVWPILLILVRYLPGEWRQWATGEFIIGFYLSLLIMGIWSLKFSQ